MNVLFILTERNGGIVLEIIASVLFYVIPASFIIWFMVNIVSSLRRNNKILEAILEELKKGN